MKHIAIIGSVGFPSRYGGFETLVQHLTEDLHEQFNLTIYCSSKHYAKNERQSGLKNVRLVFIPLKANGIQSIPYDALSILHSLRKADTLLILGVAGCFLLPFLRFFTRKNIIVNIDGMEWKRAKWNFLARFYLKWCERMAVKWAHTTVTDNEAIQEYVAREYHSESTCIAYGADHVSAVAAGTVDRKNYPFLGQPYAFKVARIEPENNIHVILEAFSTNNKQVVIVGNWNHSEYGKQLVKQYGTYPNIHLLNPIYDQQQLDVLRSNCWLYVHGHSAGGTNPSLVEAMYLELPVFAYDVNFNRETTNNEARYFQDAAGLNRLIATTGFAELQAIRKQLKSVAEHKYTWKKISSQYARLFEGSPVKQPTGLSIPLEEIISSKTH